MWTKFREPWFFVGLRTKYKSMRNAHRSSLRGRNTTSAAKRCCMRTRQSTVIKSRSHLKKIMKKYAVYVDWLDIKICISLIGLFWSFIHGLPRRHTTPLYSGCRISSSQWRPRPTWLWKSVDGSGSIPYCPGVCKKFKILSNESIIIWGFKSKNIRYG